MGDDLTAAKTLINFIVGGGGLIGLYKWLKGDKPVAGTTLEDGKVELQITGNNNRVIVVERPVVALYNNPRVRKEFGGVVRPLGRDGIDSFEIRDAHATVLQRVTKEEARFFIQPQEGAEHVIEEREYEGVYEIEKLSFTDRYKWTFSDGNATFNSSSPRWTCTTRGRWGCLRKKGFGT